MPSFTADDASLFYKEYGAGDPLVLAHGFTATGDAWSNLVSAFDGQYRVIVPDLRGHGRSTGEPETIRYAQFGADLVALLDHLDLERAHFVGHSAGAVALLFVGCEYL